MSSRSSAPYWAVRSPPVFDQVIVNGGNIDRGRSIDFEQYQASLLSESVGFWTVLGRVVAIFFAIVLCIKSTRVLFPDND